MDFRLLGPLEVVDDTGGPVPVGTGRQRALLSLLLLRANELVASDRLVEELWGASPPVTAHKMLHNQVATCGARWAGTAGWRPRAAVTD